MSPIRYPDATDDRFRAAYERYHREIEAYCRRRTSSDSVEDAVADTFLAAWRKADAMPDGSATLPWLYGVAHWVITHQWRSSMRRRRLADRLDSLGLVPVDLPEDVIVMDHETRQVLVALQALSRSDQEILRLTAWEELAPTDIALVLGISAGAVRQRLYIARRKLTDEYNRVEKGFRGSPSAQRGGVS